MSERNKSLKKCRNTKGENGISLYKIKRNKVNITLCKAKSAYFKNLVNENKKLPREFWKISKKIYPVKLGDGDHVKNFSINEEVRNNPSKVSNGFISYHASI